MPTISWTVTTCPTAATSRRTVSRSATARAVVTGRRNTGTQRAQPIQAMRPKTCLLRSALISTKPGRQAMPWTPELIHRLKGYVDASRLYRVHYHGNRVYGIDIPPADYPIEQAAIYTQEY